MGVLPNSEVPDIRIINMESRIKELVTEVCKTQLAVNAATKEIIKINAALDEHDARLDGIIKEINGQNPALDEHEGRLDDHEGRLDKLQDAVASMQKQIKGLLHEQKKGRSKTRDIARGCLIKKPAAAARPAAKRPCRPRR
jgi:chromosome segregation ATPase